MKGGENKGFYMRGGKLIDVQTEPVKLPRLRGIVDIACAEKHALALDKKHKVWSWGHGTGYRLGRHLDDPMDNNRAFRPAIVPRLPDDVVGVGAGYNHSMAFCTDEGLWAVSPCLSCTTP